MSIEEIPSDELVIMTDTFHRAFNAHGCNPSCHCCFKYVKIGEKFKLATVETHLRGTANTGIDKWAKTESREVMLCETCTINDFNKMTKKAIAKYEAHRASGGGCFRINGQIVH